MVIRSQSAMVSSRAVRDIDDRDSFFLDLLNHAKQAFRLPVGQHGGRLIHDENIDFIENRLPDFNQLLHRTR